jgi:hypothetical protein
MRLHVNVRANYMSDSPQSANVEPKQKSVESGRFRRWIAMTSPSLAAALSLWMILFSIGVTVPSAPFRNRVVVHAFSWNVELDASGQVASRPAVIAPEDPWWRIAGFLVIIVFAFTPTNIAMLCLVSAVIGNEVTRARHPGAAGPPNPPSAPPRRTRAPHRTLPVIKGAR